MTFNSLEKLGNSNFLKSFYLILCFCAWALGAQAQDHKFTFGAMQHFSFRGEADGIFAAVNMINGVRWDRNFAGLGVAYEPARNNWWWGGFGGMPNTLPVYATYRHYRGKKKRWFGLAELGPNVIVNNPWMTRETQNSTDYFKKKIGLYASVGAGMKAKIGRELYYTFDLSYNYKQTSYARNFIDQQNEWSVDDNLFQQQRILLRVGFELF